MLSLVLLALAHENSISTSHFTVGGERASAVLNCQSLTLIEELELDDDGDLLIDDDELARHRAAIESYASEHLELYTGGRAGTRLVGKVTGVKTAMDRGTGGAFPMLGQWLELELAYTAAAPIEGLVIVWRLFEVMNPGHLDYATLQWNDEDEQTFVFGMGSSTWEHETWAARRPRVVADFLERGARSKKPVWTSVALVAALLCASRGGVRPVAALLAAALGALGAGLAAPAALHPPPAFTELAASLSVAYVATDTLLRRAPRLPLLEALGFGLVHGLAARAALARELASEPQLAAALAGLELGMLGVLVPAGAALAAVLSVVPGERAAVDETADETKARWLAPRALRIALSVVAAALGFALFARRAGFLGWI